MCDYLKSLPTSVISGAVRHIASTINSEDGVSEAALIQASDRLNEQAIEVERLNKILEDMK